MDKTTTVVEEPPPFIPLIDIVNDPRYRERDGNARNEVLRSWERDMRQRNNQLGEWTPESLAEFEVATRQERERNAGFDEANISPRDEILAEMQQDTEARLQKQEAIFTTIDDYRNRRDKFDATMLRNQFLPKDEMADTADQRIDLYRKRKEIGGGDEESGKKVIDHIEKAIRVMEGKDDDKAMLVEGVIVADNDLYLNREAFTKAINAMSATDREKQMALANFDVIHPKVTEKAVDQHMETVPAFRKFAAKEVEKNPDVTEAEVLWKFKQGDAGAGQRMTDSVIRGLWTVDEGNIWLATMPTSLGLKKIGLKKAGESLEDVGFKSLETSAYEKERRGERIELLGGQKWYEEVAEFAPQLVDMTLFSLAGGPITGAAKATTRGAVKGAMKVGLARKDLLTRLAAREIKPLLKGGQISSGEQMTRWLMEGAMAPKWAAQTAGPHFFESYQRAKQNLTAQGLEGEQLEDAAIDSANGSAMRAGIFSAATVVALNRMGMGGFEKSLTNMMARSAANPKLRQQYLAHFKNAATQIAGSVGKVAGTAASEGLQESLDEGGNAILDSVVEGVELTPQNLYAASWKAARIGATMGAVAGGAMEIASKITEARSGVEKLKEVNEARRSKLKGAAENAEEAGLSEVAAALNTNAAEVGNDGSAARAEILAASLETKINAVLEAQGEVAKNPESQEAQAALDKANAEHAKVEAAYSAAKKIADSVAGVEPTKIEPTEEEPTEAELDQQINQTGTKPPTGKAAPAPVTTEAPQIKKPKTATEKAQNAFTRQGVKAKAAGVGGFVVVPEKRESGGIWFNVDTNQVEVNEEAFEKQFGKVGDDTIDRAVDEEIRHAAFWKSAVDDAGGNVAVAKKRISDMYDEFAPEPKRIVDPKTGRSIITKVKNNNKKVIDAAKQLYGEEAWFGMSSFEKGMELLRMFGQHLNVEGKFTEETWRTKIRDQRTGELVPEEQRRPATAHAQIGKVLGTDLILTDRLQNVLRGIADFVKGSKTADPKLKTFAESVNNLLENAKVTEADIEAELSEAPKVEQEKAGKAKPDWVSKELATKLSSVGINPEKLPNERPSKAELEKTAWGRKLLRAETAVKIAERNRNRNKNAAASRATIRGREEPEPSQPEQTAVSRAEQATPLKKWKEGTYGSIEGRAVKTSGDESGVVVIEEDGAALLYPHDGGTPIILSNRADAAFADNDLGIQIDTEFEQDTEQAAGWEDIGKKITSLPVERPKSRPTFVRDDGSIVTDGTVTDFVSEGVTEAGDLFVTVKDREGNEPYELHGESAMIVAIARRNASRDAELEAEVDTSIRKSTSFVFSRVLTRMVKNREALMEVLDKDSGTPSIETVEKAIDELADIERQIGKENIPNELKQRFREFVGEAFDDIAKITKRRAKTSVRPAAKARNAGTERTKADSDKAPNKKIAKEAPSAKKKAPAKKAAAKKSPSARMLSILEDAKKAEAQSQTFARDRNKFPGEDYPVPPNVVFIQPRDLNSVPISDQVFAYEYNGTAGDAARVGARSFEELLQQFPDMSQRETIFGASDEDGNTRFRLEMDQLHNEVMVRGKNALRLMESLPAESLKAEETPKKGTIRYEEYDEPTGQWVARNRDAVISKSTIPGDKPWRITVFSGQKDLQTPIGHVQLDSAVATKQSLDELSEQLGRYIRNLQLPEAWIDFKPESPPAESAASSKRDATKPEQMTPEEIVSAYRDSGFDVSFQQRKPGQGKTLSISRLEEGVIPKTAFNPRATFTSTQYAQDIDARINEFNVSAKEQQEGIAGIEFAANRPVSTAAVDTYGITLPEGYVREGDLYVFRGKDEGQTLSAATPVSPAMTARHAELEQKFNAGTITPEETAEAERLVAEAAEVAGYNVGPVWHSTPNSFDVFDLRKTQLGVHVGTQRAAEDAAKVRYKPSKTLRLFVRIKNPIRLEDESKSWRPEYIAKKIGLPNLDWINMPESGREDFHEKTLDFDQRNRWWMLQNGVDAIVYQNRNEDPGNDSYIILDSSQIKSAEPFTGIPLDERFNPEKDSILYAAAPIRQTIIQQLTADGTNVAVMSRPSIERRINKILSELPAKRRATIDDREAFVKALAADLKERATMGRKAAVTTGTVEESPMDRPAPEPTRLMPAIPGFRQVDAAMRKMPPRSLQDGRWARMGDVERRTILTDAAFKRTIREAHAQREIEVQGFPMPNPMEDDFYGRQQRQASQRELGIALGQRTGMLDTVLGKSNWRDLRMALAEKPEGVLFAATPVTSEMDAAYLDAVRRGDMETARKMVENTAKSVGEMVVVSRNTREGLVKGPTAGIFAASERFPGMTKTGEPEGPWRVSIIWRDGPEGHASFQTKEQAEFFADEYKKSEPLMFGITRDEDGNVIPLSERFNPEKDSILFAATPEFTEARARAESGEDAEMTLAFLPDETARIAMADQMDAEHQRAKAQWLESGDLRDFAKTFRLERAAQEIRAGETFIDPGEMPFDPNTALAAATPKLNDKQQKIVEAIQDNAPLVTGGEWVPLLWIRESSGLWKEDFDREIVALSRNGTVMLASNDNRAALTDQDRKAAIFLGGEDKHQVRLWNADSTVAAATPEFGDRVRMPWWSWNSEAKHGQAGFGYQPGGLWMASGKLPIKVHKTLLGGRHGTSAAQLDAEAWAKKTDAYLKKIYGKDKAKWPIQMINEALGNLDNALTRIDLAAIRQIKIDGLRVAMNAHNQRFAEAGRYDAAARNGTDYKGLSGDEAANKASSIREESREILAEDVEAYKQEARGEEGRRRVRKQNEAAQRQANALAQIETKSVDFANHLREMTAKIRELGQEMAGFAETPDSLKAAIDENAGLWLHRSYQIFDNPAYREWVRKSKDADAVRIRNNAYAFVRSEIENEWVADAVKGGMDIADAWDAINNGTAMTQEDRNQRVLARFHEYVDVAEESDRISKAVHEGMAEGKPTSITFKRGIQEKAIRELWGEWQDPNINAAISLVSLANYVAQQKALTAVAKMGLNEGWLRTKEQYDAGLVTDAKNPTTQLVPLFKEFRKDQRGQIKPNLLVSPLDNLYGPKLFRDAMNEWTDPEAAPLMWQFMKNATGLAMMAKAPLSWATGARNYAGNPASLFAQGLFMERGWVDDVIAAHKMAMHLFRADGDRATREYINDLAQRGLVGESNMVNTIQNLTKWKDTNNSEIVAFNRMIQELEDHKAGKVVKSAGWARKQVRKIVRGSLRLYGLGDEVWKDVAFRGEKRRLREAYPNKTDDEIADMAASHVRDTLQTYSLAPKAIQLLREQPFLAPFIIFRAEVMRGAFNTVKLGLQQVKEGNANGNTRLRNIGLKRLAGFGMAAAAIEATLHALALAISGFDKEDEEALRKMVPSYLENAQLLMLPSPERDKGKIRYLNLSNSNYYDGITAPFRAVIRALRDPDRGLIDAIISGAQAVPGPLFNEQIAAGSVMDVMRGVTSDGRKVWDQNADSALEKIVKSGVHVGTKAYMPGTFTSLNRMWKGYRGHVSESGRENEFGPEVWSGVLGQKVMTADMNNALEYAAKSFNFARREITGQFTKPFKSTGTQSEGAIEDAYVEANEKMLNLYREMKRKTDAAIRNGVPPQKAYATLAEEVGKETAQNIRSNRFPRIEPSSMYLREARRNGAALNEDRLGALRKGEARVKRSQPIIEINYSPTINVEP